MSHKLQNDMEKLGKVSIRNFNEKLRRRNEMYLNPNSKKSELSQEDKETPKCMSQRNLLASNVRLPKATFARYMYLDNRSLAQVQVAETLIDGWEIENRTLHCDGTSSLNMVTTMPPLM